MDGIGRLFSKYTAATIWEIGWDQLLQGPKMRLLGWSCNYSAKPCESTDGTVARHNKKNT